MNDTLPFSPEMVVAAPGPLLQVLLGPDGRPAGTRGAMRVHASTERVWAVVSDLARYHERVAMIDRVRREGDRVTIQLRFRVSLFSAGFEFTADATHEAGKWLELRYVSGEPAQIRIRFDLVPTPDGQGTVLYSAISFDIMSLGWLVKFFLKNHPEIQYGVFTGSALTLLDSVRRAVEGR